LPSTSIELRLHVSGQRVSYSYSVDGGVTFVAVGTPQPFYSSWWKAARPALFTFNTVIGAREDGRVDFDWVHCSGSAEGNRTEGDGFEMPRSAEHEPHR
jgi:hypothetical protein